MEKIFEQVLLYDFYGELLTPHQRSVYEDAVYNDLSLGEIAQERGISRQGVHDLLKRCDRILQGYESKLHLVRKFSEAKAVFARIMELTDLAGEVGFVMETGPTAGGCTQEKPAGADKAASINQMVELTRLEENMRQIREISRQWMDNF